MVKYKYTGYDNNGVYKHSRVCNTYNEAEGLLQNFPKETISLILSSGKVKVVERYNN